MNLEQVLNYIKTNLDSIINTETYTIFKIWCKSGLDEDFDSLIERIKEDGKETAKRLSN